MCKLWVLGHRDSGQPVFDRTELYLGLLGLHLELVGPSPDPGREVYLAQLGLVLVQKLAFAADMNLESHEALCLML